MKYLQLAMRVPTGRGIYAPSGFSGGLVSVSPQVSQSSPVRGLVSFEPDYCSNPVEIDFYGYGLDCWYIREDEARAAGWESGATIELPQPVLTAFGFAASNLTMPVEPTVEAGI